MMTNVILKNLEDPTDMAFLSLTDDQLKMIEWLIDNEWLYGVGLEKKGENPFYTI